MKGLFNIIKDEFCSLTTYKLRGETIEIITPYSTLRNKFVSIFIKQSEDKFIVSDGGWIDLNYYGDKMDDSSEDLIDRITSYYTLNYGVQIVTDKSGTLYYYKSCNIDSISSTVFDLANFVVGVTNALTIQYKDEQEEKEKESFRKQANDFLRINYEDNIRISQSLDDLPNINFNAVIHKNSNLYLISYITGSTPSYFSNSLRRTIVNFEISQKSKYKGRIKEKISLINDEAEGFLPSKESDLLDLLNERSSRESIIWSERDKILDYV
ncbi:MAG: hypothetical protein ACQEWG_11480 [Bacteroidota bacterium]